MISLVKGIGLLVLITLLSMGHEDSFGQASNDSIKRVEDYFEHRVTNVHQEKIFIHTDRFSYVTGETLWLAAYCSDAAIHVPVGISKVLNIELLDPSGQAVKQIRIELNDGFGKGQIFISPDIQSGSYLLRAYTNWMKNFDPEFVFYKRIDIVNPSSVRDNEDVTITVDKPDIKFFPEGGNLISGIKSKVAVKAIDKYGSGLELTGVVYDQEYNEVAKFTTSELGYAYFLLTPEATKTYTARVEIDSLIEKYSMPPVLKTGVAVSVNASESEDLKISINGTKDFLNKAYLVVHTRGVINRISELDLNQENQVIIRASELPEGISHITLLSNDFTALSERLVFKYPDNQRAIELSINQKEYNQREKLSFSLEMDDHWSEEDWARLSVSVSRSSGINHYEDNIVTSLLLTSDLKGPIAHPTVYFDPNNKSRAEQLDLVMLTNGWRRFNWNEVKSNQSITVKYPAEINAPMLSGQINENENKKLPKSLQINFLGKASVMNSLNLEPEGLFHFEVPFRINNENVHFFINQDTLQSDQVSVFSSFDLKRVDNRKFKEKFTPDSRAYLETLAVNIQISQVYRNYTQINGLQPEIQEISTPFYGTPDFLYELDNYTRFETIEDLFIEYIRSAIIRDNNKMSGLYVVNDGLLPGKALTLIDGVPIFDFDYIMNYDPIKIEKVGVVNNVYRMGDNEYQGIIDFITYKGDFDQQELPEYIIEKVYHGIESSRIFYSPDYSGDNELLKRIPDYRNTLYWNPQVTLNGNGPIDLEVFTSDDTGLYQIEINGISKEGRPIFLQSSFSVK